MQAGPSARKQSGQLFFSLKLMLQFTEGVQWFYSRENYYYSKDPEGFQHFPGGGGGGGGVGNFLQGGGPNANFYINPYNL